MFSKQLKAYEYLQKLADSWTVNEKLPTMKALAKAAKVSLTTMQKAVTTMAEEGKLRPVSGNGIFVNPSFENQNNDFTMSSVFMGSEANLTMSINEPVPWMRKFWDQAIQEFQKISPGVKIKIIFYDKMDVDAGQTDLFLCSQEVLLEQIVQKNVLECSPYVDWDQMEESLSPNLLMDTSLNNKHWAVPLFLNVSVCIFSGSALKRAELSTFSGTDTIDEFNKILLEVKDPLKTMFPKWNKPMATNLGYLPWLKKFQVKLTESGNVCQTEENRMAWRLAIDEIRESRKNCIGFPLLADSQISPFEALEQGILSCLLTSIPCRSYFDKHDWHIFKIPQIHTPINVGLVAMGRNSNYPVQAGEFMSFLIGRKGQEILASCGRIPFSKNVLSSDHLQLPSWVDKKQFLNIMENTGFYCYRNYQDRIFIEKIVNPLISSNVLLKKEATEKIVQKIITMGQHYMSQMDIDGDRH